MRREIKVTIIFFAVIGAGNFALYTETYLSNQYNRVHYIAWTDIGHVTLVLPLFDGDWHYRYDVQTNSHGLITLREEGLPQPNVVFEPNDFFCSYGSFNPHAFSINQTVGIIYYPACGYTVKSS